MSQPRRQERPIPLSYACTVAITVGALATLLPIGAILLAEPLGDADPTPDDLTKLGDALLLFALRHPLAVSLPLGATGAALCATGIAAMRGNRHAWAATIILLTFFAVLLLTFAIVGQLVLLTAATIAAVACLLTPAARAWYDEARRVEFQLVRAP